jgi:cytochrome c peroxidase
VGQLTRQRTARGDELFSGKANCNSCHHEPLWTEPGWNQHSADELKIDSFEVDRAPGRAYQTMNLVGLFVRERGLFMFPQDKGRFYHGRFQTLMDVVNSFNDRFNLGLTEQEKKDLVEYLKSL